MRLRKRKFAKCSLIFSRPAYHNKNDPVLQKTNSQLLSRMEQVKVHSRQQKEQLVLKLFEIEALYLRTPKYEVEKQVPQTSCRRGTHGPKTSCPGGQLVLEPGDNLRADIPSHDTGL